MNATARHPDLEALLADPGIAKAVREYNRADDYGRITSDHAAVVLARKVAQYAHRSLFDTPDQQHGSDISEVSPLPETVVGPLLDFLAAERARNVVITEGKLAMFSDRRKEVWDNMRSTAHTLATALQE